MTVDSVCKTTNRKDGGGLVPPDLVVVWPGFLTKGLDRPAPESVLYRCEFQNILVPEYVYGRLCCCCCPGHWTATAEWTCGN
jgi:hypothetical protein